MRSRGGGGQSSGAGGTATVAGASSGSTAGGSSSSAAGSVPLGPPPPPPPAPPADSEEGEFRPRVCRVSAWPKMLHSVTPSGKNSYVRLSQTWGKSSMDFRAVCAEHGCSLSRSGDQWRPIGRLWSWLDYGRSEECRGAADPKCAHQAYIPSHDACREARIAFELLPGSGPWLAAEAGGPGQGEPLETWGASRVRR